MTDMQAKDFCLQYIWSHRVRVALAGGVSFVMTSEPVSAKVKRMRVVWSEDNLPDHRLEVMATGENVEQLLIRCIEDVVQGYVE
jgi:hypothetical protein